MYKMGIISHVYYKQYRNNLTQVIRAAKCNYYLNIFYNFRNNTKKVWKTINEIKGNTSIKSNTKTLHYNNTVFDNPKDISEAFSKYFSNIAPQLDNNLPQSNNNLHDYLQGDYPNSMLLPILTQQDIQSVIKKLKNKNLYVNDIAVPIIKKNCNFVSIPLTILLNQSVSTGTFPAILKFAKITPIHKSGPKNDPKNYRPISQLTAFSKILENLMKSSLMHYLESKNILNSTQFGFRCKRNTFQALNIFSSDIFSAIDNNISVIYIH